MRSTPTSLEGPLSFTPLNPFGALVDLDLRTALSSAQREHFKTLFYRYKLLAFRSQSLTWQQQADTVAVLGPILNQGDKKTLDPEAYLGRNALSFHSDMGFTPEPYRVISLHAVQVEDDTTSTLFVDAGRAYARLPQALKERIEPLRARSELPLADTERVPQDVVPHVVRPLAITHPVTQDRTLYISEAHTMAIEGVATPEGEALLRELATALYSPDNLYEHSWRNGDLLIWDNLALQHARRRIPEGMPRRLQRVTGASRTFEEVCPAFTSRSEYLQLASTVAGDRCVNRWTSFLAQSSRSAALPQGSGAQ